MRDLYKRLGLRARESNLSLIEQVLRTGSLAMDDREDAKAILLMPERKRAYDLQHALLETIGNVRSRMNLSHSGSWVLNDCADFSPTSQAYTSHSREPSEASSTHRTVWVASVLVLAAFVAWIFHASRASEDSIGSEGSAPSMPMFGAGKGRAPGDRSNGGQGGGSNPNDFVDVPQVETALPRPETGMVLKTFASDGAGPFEIKTRGETNYYVKLVRSGKGSTAMTVFIRGGESYEARLPLGIYELRYAVGTHWYGTEKLFGGDTKYSRADDTFPIRKTADGYSGWTVELYLQENGNLEVEPIAASEF